MKQFRFSLERMLSYRRAQAEAAEREFAAVLSQVQKIAFEIRSLEDEREVRAMELLEQRLTADTRRDVLTGHSYLQVMWMRMVRLRKELEGWQGKLDDARMRLEEARKELKALETLRESKLKEYETEKRREETREADDAARNAFLKRVRKEGGADADD
ncbi:MAG TPA: flagellar export protein FliJ [Planctomycetes bacterium]|nr:flagellar export protein FliJ [Planctomycetota bacterium]